MDHRLRLSRYCGDDLPWAGVPREPVSTFIGLTALIESGIGIFTFIGGASAAGLIGGAIVTGAVLTGAAFVMRKTVPDVGGLDNVGAANINTPSARGSIREAASPQRRIYGRVGGLGGGWLFYDDATAQYQYLMLGLARGRIQAIRSVTINNNRITFSGGTPFNTILDPVGVEGQDYVGNLNACFRNGSADQTKDPLLDAYFPASGSEIVYDSTGLNVVNLPASFRQRGYATASFRAKFGTTQDQFDARWGHVAFINPLMEVDGHPLFDPRDPSQDMNDESTWKFYYDGREPGRNPTLIQRDWLCQPFGGRLRADQIRLDEMIEAANYDDEMVGDRDGNLRVRHQADGLVLLNDNPRQVTEAMLTANRAWIVNSRGRVGWVASKPLTPVLTITETDIRGGFDFRDSAAKNDQFNRVRTRFPSPDKDFAEDDGPVLDRADLRAGEDGDELLDTSVRTPFTTDQRAVQWLSQQFLDDSRTGKALDIASLDAISARILKRKLGNVVRVQHRFYPEIDGIYQIRKDAISSDWTGVSWSLREYDSSIASRDRSADQQDYQVGEAA